MNFSDKWTLFVVNEITPWFVVKLLSSNSSKMSWINFENLSIMMSNNSASSHEFKQDAGSQMKWCQSSFVTCVTSINIPKLKMDQHCFTWRLNIVISEMSKLIKHRIQTWPKRLPYRMESIFYSLSIDWQQANEFVCCVYVT